MAGFGRALKDRVLAIFGAKNTAYTNTIDLGGSSQPTDNKATWNYGFPSKTMLPVDTTNPSAGGIPPNGKDMNGVLNSISAECYNAMNGAMANEWIAPNVWKSVDSSWSGYSAGAVVLYPTGNTATKKEFYQSVANNNLDTPSQSDKWVNISYIPTRNYMPDWNRGGITGSAPFTMPYDGWVSLRYIGAHWKEVSLYAGSRTITVGYGQARGDEYHSAMANTFICFGGTVITYSRGYQEGTRDPYSQWCEFVVQWCPFIGE